MNRLSPEQGQLLLALARNAIVQKFSQNPAQPTLPLAQPDWLKQPGAVFVTLTQQGDLRGCIGSLEVSRPLLEDLQANARAAAFSDPRFLPLSRTELADTCIEVSLLSPAEIINFTSEADALTQLQPHIDGVILEYGSRRATGRSTCGIAMAMRVVRGAEVRIVCGRTQRTLIHIGLAHQHGTGRAQPGYHMRVTMHRPFASGQAGTRRPTSHVKVLPSRRSPNRFARIMFHECGQILRSKRHQKRKTIFPLQSPPFQSGCRRRA